MHDSLQYDLAFQLRLFPIQWGRLFAHRHGTPHAASTLQELNFSLGGSTVRAHVMPQKYTIN